MEYIAYATQALECTKVPMNCMEIQFPLRVQLRSLLMLYLLLYPGGVLRGIEYVWLSKHLGGTITFSVK